jgi:1,4-alpha-glucan branching enzyme
MLTKRYLKSRPVCKVTFTLPEAVEAETACLVGDFNDWDTQTMPMKKRNQQFSLTIELAPGREYQFRYLVNGREWYNDWNADRYTPNPFGGDNSVVII